MRRLIRIETLSVNKTMSNEEILKLSIKKAVNNGWTIPSKNYLDLIQDKDKISEKTWEAIFDMMIRENRFQKFWFSHDFAKSFWGDYPERYMYYVSDMPGIKEFAWKNRAEIREGTTIPYWKYNLSLMVLEEDPIKYLKQFLLKEDSKEAQTKESDTSEA